MLTVAIAVRNDAALVRGLVAAGVRGVPAPLDDPPALVAIVRRSGSAVVLVDLDLPHAGALALLAGLRAAPDVRSLVCTRSVRPDALRPAFERGATGCIAGPLAARRLALALHAAARGEPVLSPALTWQLLAELAAPHGAVRPLDARGVTRREREVLGMLAAGRRTTDVAHDLALSRETVRGHVKSALRKLGVHTCAAAVALLVAERVAPTGPTLAGVSDGRVTAYVGLGANVGDPRAQLAAAVAALAALPGLELLAVSSVYESDPVGPVRDQPAFLNAVAEVTTTLGPERLLAALQGIEDSLGRVRSIRFGPRTCDLDLLLYGDVVSDDPALTLPHPRLAERRFVLDPLAELAPMLVLPDGRRVRDLRAAVADQGVRRDARLP
jgi:2-amino-4-hydroxy-6-hydroxymethyldihydropteridine diphosphokinase